MTAANDYGGLRRRRGYAVSVPSTTIRDGDNLTYRDRGILAFLLDQKDGWIVRSEQIANAGKKCEGRDAIRTSLKNLYAAGYYRQEKRFIRSSTSGKYEWRSGGSLSDVPVPEWKSQYQAFRGQPVVMYQQGDGTFRIRYPDGRVHDQPEEITPVGISEDDIHEDDARPEDGFPGPGTPEVKPQVNPETGFPAPGNPDAGTPGTGTPAPGPPALLSNTMKGNHEVKTRGSSNHANAHARSTTQPDTHDQPPLSETMPDAPAKEPTIRDRAFGVARWWVELLNTDGVTVAPRGRSTPLHGIASLLTGPLRVYTDEQVKAGLRELNEPWPTSAALERTLVRMTSRGTVGTGQRSRGRASGTPAKGRSMADKWDRYEQQAARKVASQ